MRRLGGLVCRASAAVLVCAGLPAASIAVGATAAGATPSCIGTTPVVCTYDYNGTGGGGTDGSRQDFTVPVGVSAVTIDARGAQGGGDPLGGGGAGGLGGHEQATIAVTPGEVLGVYVGGRPGGSPGGYNGGGSGNGFSPGGGGASDVRRAPEALADRLVVAGGGGGAGGQFLTANPMFGGSLHGGPGGGPSGGQSSEGSCTSSGTCGAGGGPSSGGGHGTCSAGTATDGTEGVGGNAGSCGAGGGGGFFGGGGGGFGPDGQFTVVGPGGGGSGHVAAPATASAEEQGVRAGHGVVTITYTRPATKVPVGAVACPVAGTASFNKPLTDTPSAKVVKVKLTLAGSGCDASLVTGGKAPITDVAVKATLFLAPGAICSSAPSSVVKPQKLQVKWQGRNAKNKLMTVAVTNTTANPFGYSVLVPLFPLSSPVLTNPKKAFANDHIGSTLVVGDSSFAQQAACASAEGLVTVNVVGVIAATP